MFQGLSPQKNVTEERGKIDTGNSVSAKKKIRKPDTETLTA